MTRCQIKIILSLKKNKKYKWKKNTFLCAVKNFYLKFVAFISRCLIWTSRTQLYSYDTSWTSRVQLSSYNCFMSLFANSLPFNQFCVGFDWLIFLLVIIFLFLSTLGEFCFGAGYFSTSKYSWALFWDAVKLLGKCLIVYGLAFKNLVETEQLLVSGKLFHITDKTWHWVPYPMTPHIMMLSCLAVGTGTFPGPVWVAQPLRQVFIQPRRFLTYVFPAVDVVYSLSCVQLFGTPRTAAHQAPLSMGLPRQEY